LATGVVLVADAPSYACENPVTPPENLNELVGYCEKSGAEILHDMNTAPPDVIYRIVPGCLEMPPVPGDGCLNPRECLEPPNSWLYWVQRSNDGGATWFWHARTCLTDEERDSLQVITWHQVWSRMKNLDWAEAELVIQPPDGRTMVNLKTNFYTTTTEPTSKPIKLLGQKVEIEATPAEYTWHFGDGETRSGSDPGAAYPDLRITHVYLDAGVTVSPSVDVTYQGQYRVNGGNWTAIPQTLTVPGTPVTLQVLSATPHLVG
jgi:hypothetical protein